MGDLIGKTVSGTLSFINGTEMKRLVELDDLGGKLTKSEKSKIISDAVRINILYMIAKAGSGHIGSSFSAIDVMTWLFTNEMRITNGSAHDLFFSSKGHDAPALYALMQACGMMDVELLHKLRRIDGLPGHPHVETPGIVTNTGALGMGISKAKGLLKAAKHNHSDRRIYVMTGDGELQEGQFWESLSSAANDKLSNLTVLVDHNKIQSDTWVKNVNDLGDLAAKFSAFGWFAQRVDGHDFEALAVALTETRKSELPSIIICDTIKGKGVSFMQGDAMKPDQLLYGYHSGAPTKEEYLNGLSEISNRLNAQLATYDLETVQLSQTLVSAASSTLSDIEGKEHSLIGAWSDAICSLAQDYPELYALDADLMLDCGLVNFRSMYPERFVECGIAEQDMVSTAGGMALGGLLPIVHSFSCFLTTRANEQIYNNCSESSKIIYMGALSGIVPGGPGHSHQSVRDISCVGSMPGMLMAEPASEQDVAPLLKTLIEKHNGPSYVRLVSIPCRLPNEITDANSDYDIGCGKVILQGQDVLIVSSGPVMLPSAVQVAAQLRKRNISVGVCNLPWLNKVDLDWLDKTIRPYQSLITIDNHYQHGGQGSYISQAVHQLGSSIKVLNIGVEALPACGTNAEVLMHHRLDVDSLVERVAAIC